MVLVGDRRVELDEVDPYFFDAHRDLGVALYVQRRLVPAIAAYRHALLIDPTDQDTHYNLGIAFLAAGNREGALEQVRVLRSMGSEAAAALLGEIEPVGD